MLLYYSLNRLLFYLTDFWRYYFIESFNFLWASYNQAIFNIERQVGFFVNIRYFTVPIWREYSFVAYLISIPVRLFKIITGGLVILLVSAFYIVAYVIWVIMPFYCLGKFIKS